MASKDTRAIDVEAIFTRTLDTSDVVTFQSAEGGTYKMRQVEYKGRTIKCDPLFPNIEKMLESLPKYKARSDDVWLLSYPRSGTHWMYEILGILLSGKEECHAHFKINGMLELAEDIDCFEVLESPRLLNTHINPDVLPSSIFEKTKVVIMLRNPKSMSVSFYHFYQSAAAVNYTGSFNGFMIDYLTGALCELFGGNWFEYYLPVWEKYRSSPNVKFVFYEELKKDPVPVLQELSRFLGVEKDKDFCAQVAELASIEKMKASKGKDETTFKEVESLKKILPSFIRKGEIDDWKNHFTVAQNEAFDKEYQKQMEKYPDLAKKIQFS